jgi:cyanate permease
LLVGAGFAFGMFIPTTTIATNWFFTKRPLAFSFLVTSGGIGGLAMPPIIAELITVTSWRISWIFLAALLLLLNLGIAVPFLIRNKPEDIGQYPDGATNRIGEQNLVSKNNRRAGKWAIITEAMHDAAFWHIIVFCIAFMFALQTMVTHQVAYLKDLGYSPVIASTTLGLIPGISIAGRFSYGFLARWFKAEWLTITFVGSMLLGLAIFVRVTSFPAIVVYTVLFGFGYGALIVARTDLIAQYYGQEIYPELQGLIFPLQNTIAAAAPWIAGTIYDVTGTYTLAFMIVIGLLILGLISGFLLRSSSSQKGSPRPV